MRRREFLVASAATLALPAVARSANTSVLKFIPFSDQAVLDPIWTPAANDHGIMVFDTLYGQTSGEQNYAVTPQMVAGHTVADDGKV
jgi:peptide/nickel transport system substrate-binding protein